MTSSEATLKILSNKVRVVLFCSVLLTKSRKIEAMNLAKRTIGVLLVSQMTSNYKLNTGRLNRGTNVRGNICMWECMTGMVNRLGDKSPPPFCKIMGIESPYTASITHCKRNRKILWYTYTVMCLWTKSKNTTTTKQKKRTKQEAPQCDETRFSTI